MKVKTKATDECENCATDQQHCFLGDLSCNCKRCDDALKQEVFAYINEHCERCSANSYILLENHYLTDRMKKIIENASHDTLYMMWLFYNTEDKDWYKTEKEEAVFTKEFNKSWIRRLIRKIRT
jgi:hypothetical protein